MPGKVVLLAVLALAVGGCGSGGSRSADTGDEPGADERRPTVFDPLTGTLDRAAGVQQTVDDQAAELRRRIEEAER